MTPTAGIERRGGLRYLTVRRSGRRLSRCAWSGRAGLGNGLHRSKFTRVTVTARTRRGASRRLAAWIAGNVP